MADKEILNKLISDTIHCMMEQGLVDEQFTLVYSLKHTAGGPSYVTYIIPEFCSSARDVINLLTRAVNIKRCRLNFNVIREHAYKVKESALCFGARRMALAFAKFEPATDNKSKKQCVGAMTEAEQEFNNLEEKLQVVLEMERRLI